ncbi:hypothetical protein TAMA11512_08050 [Selenomonas sp. TAMA-11512]|uniref:cell division protein SepF n=1 Tax=Selenomonas sp. TAMA-11512 TaxID=3095337 RepID=UPI00308E2045|nr:hypothetical protein TAMA11512_08050 [Selenomonas sp. TAMA-11512]
MGFINKVYSKIGFGDQDDLDDGVDALLEEEEEREKARERESLRGAKSQNIVDFQPTSPTAPASVSTVTNYKMKVIVIEPKSFDDAQQVANCLKEKRPVVINFGETDTEDAKRIIDFISGTTYALSGEIKKVGHNVFLCAPSNVNVSYAEEKRGSVTAEMPWLKKK